MQKKIIDQQQESLWEEKYTVCSSHHMLADDFTNHLPELKSLLLEAWDFHFLPVSVTRLGYLSVCTWMTDSLGSATITPCKPTLHPKAENVYIFNRISAHHKPPDRQRHHPCGITPCSPYSGMLSGAQCSYHLHVQALLIKTWTKQDYWALIDISH